MDRLWGAFLPVPAERAGGAQRRRPVQAGRARRWRCSTRRATPRTMSPSTTQPRRAPVHRRRGRGALAGPQLCAPADPAARSRPGPLERSIDRMMDPDPLPAALYLTHFGPFADAPRHFTNWATGSRSGAASSRRPCARGRRRAEVIHTLARAGTRPAPGHGGRRAGRPLRAGRQLRDERGRLHPLLPQAQPGAGGLEGMMGAGG